jgi:hypothetical protein
MAHDLNDRTSPPDAWHDVLRAAVDAQHLVPGSVAVGGTAAALYAHHRLSVDTDLLVPNLVERFTEVRELLENTPRWKTARVRTPKLILGALNGVPVGFRQMIRPVPVATAEIQTPVGPIVVPTLDEVLGMKAYLAYSRNATRDFVDFAALSTCLDDDAVIASLLLSDQRYGLLQTDSVALEIAKTLAEPNPYDLDTIDLSSYKGIRPPWNNWPHCESICKRWGLEFAEVLLKGPSP